MKAIKSQDHFFLPFWNIFQEGYRNVPRWKGYCDVNPNLPLQTNLEHQNSLNMVFASALPFLGEPELNRSLLIQASLLHELGEVDNGDTLYHLKTEEKHLRELLSFDRIITKHFSFFEPWSVKSCRRAYILQHVVNEGLTFSGHSWAEDMLRNTRKVYLAEGQVFDALERLDYVLYALKAYQKCGDVVILKHVYCNQVKRLDGYAKTIKGFNKFWTKEVSAAAKQFMRRYADIPSEREAGGIPAAYAHAVKKGYMTL
ncbi:MAG: hypothetical protein R3B55_00170 [Candidatus Paceibacterota bacterium]